jgi:hypothetical protein
MIWGKVGDPYIIVWTSMIDKLAEECSKAVELGYKPAGGPWTSVVSGNTNWIYQAMWREPSMEEQDGRHL